MSLNLIMPHGSLDDRYYTPRYDSDPYMALPVSPPYYEHGHKRQKTNSFSMNEPTSRVPLFETQQTPPSECELAWSTELPIASSMAMNHFESMPAYADPSSMMMVVGPHDAYPSPPQSSCAPMERYQSTLDLCETPDAAWLSSQLACDFAMSRSAPTTFPAYTDIFPDPIATAPAPMSSSVGAPVEQLPRNRKRRTTSFTSVASSMPGYTRSVGSRSASPTACEMSRWGRQNSDGTWSCAYHGCSSRSTFNRGCDLRKHYKRHTKSLFCRHRDCPQAREGGFSSKKDRARHEAKHNPSIMCGWTGCGRMFSRVDNMKDHMRRVHRSKSGNEDA